MPASDPLNRVGPNAKKIPRRTFNTLIDMARIVRADQPLALSADDTRRLRRETFDAIVLSSTRDGANWRWSYEFAEVLCEEDGYDAWATKTNGRTGTAYNRVEDINGTSGLLGNGVNLANLPPGIEPTPVPINSIIEVTVYAGAPEPRYWFSRVTIPDGVCGS